MKQIEVSIMGQSYLLGCPEGGEERLREAVVQLDREMCAIRDSGKLKARERIAVLAALNLAYILVDRPTVSSDTTTHASAEAASDTTPSPEYVDKLIARLDQALDMDGHLI
ncbi:MAG: cell division protein ZapA [Aquabacterium sp.]|uniref:cell division protein ZapA n=1 Tax=Aquabacterium sp. TaxID=1872578 RepID=UPI003BD61843